MPSEPTPTPGRQRTKAAVLYFVASTVALIAPVYTELGNHVEPRVLGLPWSLVYVLLVVAANFFVLVGLYLTRAIDMDPPDPHAEGPSPPEA